MHIYARTVPCIWDCTWLNQARVLHAVIHRRKLWHAHMTPRIRAAALFTEGRIIDYSVAMLLVSPRLVSVTSPCTWIHVQLLSHVCNMCSPTDQEEPQSRLTMATGHYAAQANIWLALPQQRPPSPPHPTPPRSTPGHSRHTNHLPPVSSQAGGPFPPRPSCSAMQSAAGLPRPALSAAGVPCRVAHTPECPHLFPLVQRALPPQPRPLQWPADRQPRPCRLYSTETLGHVVVQLRHVVAAPGGAGQVALGQQGFIVLGHLARRPDALLHLQQLLHARIPVACVCTPGGWEWW